MNSFVSQITIFGLVLFFLTACGGGGGGSDGSDGSGTSNAGGKVPENKAPAVTSSSMPIYLENGKISYSFQSTEVGTINYFGSCSSLTHDAIVGNNNIIFESLGEGLYNDCLVSVTDLSGITSNKFPVPEFTIPDESAPEISLLSAISDRRIHTPTFIFESTEAGVIKLTGGCSSETTNIIAGKNTVELSYLENGTYSDCSFYITDEASNTSNSLEIPIFTISVPPKKTLISAWVGNNSLVTLQSEVDGYEFYRAGEDSCDLRNYQSCYKGQMDLLNGDVIKDTTLTKNYPQRAFYTLKDDEVISETKELSLTKFDGRIGYQLISFNNKAWIIGGMNDSYKNDVWSSEDGENWKLVDSSADFSPRSGHSAVVFNGLIWVIGGHDGSYKNDVWSSPDGRSWTLRSSNANFSSRSRHKTIAHNNKLWIVAGQDTDQEYNDVWSSSDGINWEEISSSAGFTPRKGHGLISFNDKLWIISGGSYLNDVWSSIDGVTWLPETTSAPFSGTDVNVALLDNKMWYVNRLVWSSSDGINWNKENAIPSLKHQSHTETIHFNNSLLSIGGITERYKYGTYDSAYSNEAWSTQDGVVWKEISNAPKFTRRDNSEAIVFNDKMWLIGGYDGGYKNDIWSSEDGINWMLELETAPFRGVKNFQSIVFNNKIWVIGGAVNGSSDDIWSSTNGIDWILEVDQAAFGARSGHQVVTWKNKLWLIGGSHDSGFKNDVWYSSNGINWYKSTTGNFTPRTSHQVEVFNNKIWVIGGMEYTTSGYQRLNDVWSSVDGTNWVLETPAPGFKARDLHQTNVFENKLWVIGGNASIPGSVEGLSDVWSSENGVDWSRGSGLPEAIRAHTVVNFNQKMFIIGGGDNNGRTNAVWSYDSVDKWRRAFHTTIEFPPLLVQ